MASETTQKTPRFGVVDDQGEYRVLEQDRAMHVQQVKYFIIPYSVPWEDDVQVVSVVPTGLNDGDRGMGDDITYFATIEDYGDVPPNAPHWKIEVTIHGYPYPNFQPIEVNTHGPVSFAHFKSNESLLNYIKRNL